MIHESNNDDPGTDDGNQDVPLIDSGNDHQHSSSFAGEDASEESNGDSHLYIIHAITAINQ